MASILKIDVLQERYANTGILLSGQINGPLGEIITREGRLKLPNEFAANSLNIANAFAANTITANLYSGITLNMIENVAAAANANQVLTADGTGNFFFADAATELKELTDVNSTATANQVLTADGTGSFFFADAATELKELTDVNSTATANQVLTADGTGSFFFAAASDPITVQKTNTTNAILSTVTNVNDFRFDEDSGFDIVDLGSGAVKIQMNSTFKTWKVDGQDDLVATGLDTIELVAGDGITLTTNANGSPYKTITFTGPNVIDGNQKLITASDNFAAGDIVIYNNGNYIKPLISTSGFNATATDSNPLAIQGPLATVIYDQLTDRYALFSRNNNKLYAVVAQATSTGFTLGAELEFYTNDCSDYSLVIDKNANKIICAWVEPYGLRVASFEIDPATNTITMGNVAADSNTNNLYHVSIGYDTDTGKFLIVYGGSTNVRCSAGYVDGQNIVLGTQQSITANNGITYASVAYDKTAQRFFIAHNADSRVAAVAQINGDNSINIGAWTTIPNQNIPGNPYYKTSEGKVYLPYVSTNFKASLGEVTIDNVTNTLTFNTVEFTGTSDVFGLGMVYLELIDQFYFYYKKWPYAGGQEYIADVVFNNGTPSLANSRETVNMFTYNGAEDKATVGIDRVVSTYGAGPVYLTYSTFTTINSNISSWIGIAAENINSGDNGKIDLPGTVNSNQNGLVRNSIYYISAFGLLTTTPTDYGIVGKALSSTEIQIFAETSLTKLVDVNSTATANQVLTAFGNGSFYFADAATELKELTDVNPTATANQVLTADGSGNFFFANNAAAEITTLTDIGIADGEADQVLTTDGNGSFFFGHTLSVLNQDLISGGEITQLRDCRTVIDLGTVDTRLGYAAPEGSKTVLLANDSTIVSSSSVSIISEENSIVKLNNIHLLSDVNFDAIANNSISGNKIYGGLLSADTANIGNNVLVVDSSGNVGVGTSTPNGALTVTGAVASFPNIGDAVQIGAAGGYSSIEMSGSTGGLIDFNAGDGTDFKGRIIYDNNNNVLDFHTNSAFKMRIDSSGNVGIGTSSPTSFGATYKSLELSGTNGAIYQMAVNGVLRARLQTVATQSEWITETGSNFPLVFKPNDTERMRIDSSGRVTMPYQPSFAAYKANNNNYSAYTPLDWTTTHNTGNHFNGQSFTAPISGLYHFEYGGITHSVSNYFYLGFSLNGSVNVQPAKGSWRHLPQTEGEYHHMHTSLTLYLNAGDYIDARTGFNGGTPYLEGDRSSFSGYLVG